MLLINHGSQVDARNEWESTPLHLASREGHVQFARRLIERGADVNARNEDNLTPLHLASQARNAELVSMLVEHGASQSGLTLFRA
jgi:ankyrin repeat protein